MYTNIPQQEEALVGVQEYLQFLNLTASPNTNMMPRVGMQRNSGKKRTYIKGGGGGVSRFTKKIPSLTLSLICSIFWYFNL